MGEEVDVGIHLSYLCFLFCWPLLLFFPFILYTFSYYACLSGKLKNGNVRWLRTRWGDCSFLFNLPVNIFVIKLLFCNISSKNYKFSVQNMIYVGSILVEGLILDLAWRGIRCLIPWKWRCDGYLSLRNILRENLG